MNNALSNNTVVRYKRNNDSNTIAIIIGYNGQWTYNELRQEDLGVNWYRAGNAEYWFNLFESEIIEVIAENATFDDMLKISHFDYEINSIKNIIYRCTDEQMESKYRSGMISQDVYEVCCWLWRNSASCLSSNLFQYEGATLTKEQQILAQPFYRFVRVYEVL